MCLPAGRVRLQITGCCWLYSALVCLHVDCGFGVRDVFIKPLASSPCLQHYAAKALENVFGLGGPWAQQLATAETLERLAQVRGGGGGGGWACGMVLTVLKT